MLEGTFIGSWFDFPSYIKVFSTGKDNISIMLD
jgi:hypothetical protein